MRAGHTDASAKCEKVLRADGLKSLERETGRGACEAPRSEGELRRGRLYIWEPEPRTRLRRARRASPAMPAATWSERARASEGTLISYADALP